MGLLFFSVILAILLCFFLSAPFAYYPLIIIVFLVSTICLPILQKRFKPIKKLLYPIAAAAFIAVFTLTSWFIFRPVHNNVPKPGPVDMKKKAVIFYCQGEMEKYSPLYAKELLSSYPYILKPMKAFQLKRLYKEIGSSSKNYNLIRVASQVKNSLLNNGPYYFYIAFQISIRA